METEIQAPSDTRANDLRELTDAYNADVIQALSNYVACGKQLHFVSGGDQQGRLVITFTFEDGVALNEAVTQAMEAGVGRRWTVLP